MGRTGRKAGRSFEHHKVLEPCHLLALPAEIRSTIHHYAVFHRAPLGLYPAAPAVDSECVWQSGNDERIIVKPSESALSRACHQLRAEAFPIFYSKSTFRDSYFHADCQDFLLALSPVKRTMLRAVQIRARTSVQPFLCAPCVERAKVKLGEMAVWLRENAIALREGVLQVGVKLIDCGGVKWMSEPEGQCERQL